MIHIGGTIPWAGVLDCEKKKEEEEKGKKKEKVSLSNTSLCGYEMTSGLRILPS